MTTANPTTLAPTSLAPTTCTPTDSEENFSGANPLNNWTEVWQGAHFNLSIVDANGGARVGTKDLHWDSINAGSSRRFASYDSPGECKNVELLALVDSDTPEGDQLFRLYARASGSEGNESAYYTNIQSNICINKYVAGAFSNVVQDTYFELLSNSPMYWIRFRLNGTSLKIKLWSYYSYEPIEWGLSGTDSSLTIGKVGIGQYAQDDFDQSYFATGVGGSSPSVPALTHGDVDRLSTLLISTALSSAINYCIFIPYRVPSTANGEWIYEIAVYFKDVSDDVRLSLYKGSDEADVTDATLIEDFGQVSPVANSINYYSLSSSTQISTNDVFYIGIKGNDGTTKLIYTGSSVQASAQLSNDSGRWNATADLGNDETVAFPANLLGATNATQADHWYEAYLLLRGTGTTAAPTTVAPTSLAPTSLAPTSLAPTTSAPPTSLPPTTSSPPTSPAPTTSPVASTPPPTTLAPTTATPPTSLAPTSLAPTTSAPTTLAPTTAAPTSAPTTLAPTTSAPTTPAPTTTVPTTSAPTTAIPTTAAPTTIEPTTPIPTTSAPTTLAPTLAPTTTLTTLAPTTNIPEEICIRNLNSIIIKETTFNGNLC